MAPFSLFVRALMAYSVHEHQEGHARRIDLWLQPRSFTIEDDGRGMGLHRDGYVDSLMGLLVGGPGPVQLHGIGLALIAASTPHLSIDSRRGGSLWTQTFAWGMAEGPPQREPGGTETGTRITLALPPGSPAIERADLLVQVDLWRERNPGLTINVH